MHRIATYLSALLLAAIFFTANSRAETLRIGINIWTPWIIRTGDSYSGIVVEVCQEAIRRAGHDSVVVEMPQKRRELVEWGRMVDVEPGCEKSWRRIFDNVSAYTEPYIETRNVVISRRGTYAPPCTLETFFGDVLGCNLGYYYTDGFNEAFELGKIRRDDSGTGHNLITKLVKNRFKAAIADTHEWKYWMRKLGHDTKEFEESYQFSHPNQLRIRLHIGKQHLVFPLNKALSGMKADNTIDKIVKKYITE